MNGQIIGMIHFLLLVQNICWVAGTQQLLTGGALVFHIIYKNYLWALSPAPLACLLNSSRIFPQDSLNDLYVLNITCIETHNQIIHFYSGIYP